MHDQQLPEGQGRSLPAPAPRTAGTSPSSSRMFAGYLTNIEELLDEEHWDAALREAFELPRIAVALADPRLRCSVDAVKTWCEEWIRPPGAERDAHGIDYERIARAVSERLARLAEPEAVPTRALRRLQLQRHLRTPPRGYTWRGDGLDAHENANLEMCRALVDAARRWYARSGVHDPTVQGNLARLAVLR